MTGGWKAFAIKQTGDTPQQQPPGFPRLRVFHVALNVLTMGFERRAWGRRARAPAARPRAADSRNPSPHTTARRYNLLSTSQAGANEAALRELLQGCGQLRELDASDNSSVTVETLRAVPSVALTTLLLGGTRATTDEARHSAALPRLATAGRLRRPRSHRHPSPAGRRLPSSSPSAGGTASGSFRWAAPGRPAVG